MIQPNGSVFSEIDHSEDPEAAMRRLMVIAVMFGFVSFAQAEMPGKLPFDSIPFLNHSSPVAKADTAVQNGEKDAHRDGTKGFQGKTPGDFKAAIPPLPEDVCAAGNREKGTYFATIDHLILKLDEMIARNRIESKQKANGGLVSEHVKANQPAAARLHELSGEFMQLADRVAARLDRGRTRLNDFNQKEAPKAEVMYKAEISPILRKMAGPCGAGMTAEKEARACGQLRQQLDAAHDRYCVQFGPRYRDALLDVRRACETSLPDCIRLEQIQDELLDFQEGGALERKTAQTAQWGFEAVKECVQLLNGAYNYNLRSDRE